MQMKYEVKYVYVSQNNWHDRLKACNSDEKERYIVIDCTPLHVFHIEKHVTRAVFHNPVPGAAHFPTVPNQTHLNQLISSLVETPGPEIYWLE